MRKILLSLLTVLFVLSGCYNREKLVDKSKLTGYDFRLYQQTPVWELAKAVVGAEFNIDVNKVWEALKGLILEK